MKCQRRYAIAAIAVGAAAIVTLPIWTMGLAVLADSERTILSKSLSPNGKQIAQVERLVVGGVPNIVIMTRPAWAPDWYLVGCAATSHYGEALASVRWISDDLIEIAHDDQRASWSSDSAPFHNEPCRQPQILLRPRDRG